MTTKTAPVVDCDELVERMMGSTEMAERMLQKFLEMGEADCDLMESTVRLGDREATASVAHRHKGAAQTMAVPRIAENAARLERGAFADQTSELLAMVEQIRTAHRELRVAVRHGLARCSLKSGSERP